MKTARGTIMERLGGQRHAGPSSGAVPARRDGRINAVAWTPRGELEYHDWLLEGRRIGLMLRASPWWIGDWLLYGTARWGETYVEAAKITTYDPKSLRNMRYVASRFDLSLRRDNLTWSHHALLASLGPDTQAFWLDRASEDRLSVQDLRLELRAAHRCGCASVKELSSPKRPNVLVCPNCGDPVPIPAALIRSEQRRGANA
jgi:hypothetical protein